MQLWPAASLRDKTCGRCCRPIAARPSRLPEWTSTLYGIQTVGVSDAHGAEHDCALTTGEACGHDRWRRMSDDASDV